MNIIKSLQSPKIFFKFIHCLFIIGTLVLNQVYVPYAYAEDNGNTRPCQGDDDCTLESGGETDISKAEQALNMITYITVLVSAFVAGKALLKCPAGFKIPSVMAFVIASAAYYAQEIAFFAIYKNTMTNKYKDARDSLTKSVTLTLSDDDPSKYDAQRHDLEVLRDSTVFFKELTWAKTGILIALSVALIAAAAMSISELVAYKSAYATYTATLAAFNAAFAPTLTIEAESAPGLPFLAPVIPIVTSMKATLPTVIVPIIMAAPGAPVPEGAPTSAANNEAIAQAATGALSVMLGQINAFNVAVPGMQSAIAACLAIVPTPFTPNVLYPNCVAAQPLLVTDITRMNALQATIPPLVTAFQTLARVSHFTLNSCIPMPPNPVAGLFMEQNMLQKNNHLFANFKDSFSKGNISSLLENALNNLIPNAQAQGPGDGMDFLKLVGVASVALLAVVLTQFGVVKTLFDTHAYHPGSRAAFISFVAALVSTLAGLTGGTIPLLDKRIAEIDELLAKLERLKNTVPTPTPDRSGGPGGTGAGGGGGNPLVLPQNPNPDDNAEQPVTCSESSSGGGCVCKMNNQCIVTQGHSGAEEGFQFLNFPPGLINNLNKQKEMLQLLARGDYAGAAKLANEINGNRGAMKKLLRNLIKDAAKLDKNKNFKEFSHDKAVAGMLAEFKNSSRGLMDKYPNLSSAAGDANFSLLNSTSGSSEMNKELAETKETVVTDTSYDDLMRQLQQNGGAGADVKAAKAETEATDAKDPSKEEKLSDALENFNIKEQSIVKDNGKPIWEIISGRYKRSFLTQFIESRKKKITGEQPADKK